MYENEVNITEKGTMGNQATEPFILFALAGTTYAIHSRYVRQMEMLGNITPVPNTPDFIEGVMFSRGQVIPVINLRLRLGFPKIAYDLSTRVIVTKYEDRTVGLIVDSSREYVKLQVDLIQPAPDFVTGLSGDYLGGIAKAGDRIILIFNVEGILKNGSAIETINNKKEE